jgi:chromosome segregation and condensation protein ScpB
VRALLERGFIQVSERDKNRGNAALYGTTGEFLRAFGLRSQSELPRQADLATPSAEGEAEVAQVEVKAPEKSE